MRWARPLGLVAAVLLIAATATAQIGVTPPFSEIVIDGRVSTHSLRLLNFGDKDVDVGVVIYHWDMDEANQVRIIPPTEQSLDQWLIVNPLRFTIPADGSQVVRYAVRPKVEPEPGEHRAMIFFEEQPTPVAEGEDPVMEILFRLGTAIYAQAGEIQRTAELHAVAADAAGMVVDLTASGNAHVRLDGQYAVWRTEDFPGADATTPIAGLGAPDSEVPETIVTVGALPNKPVLPGTRREITLAFDPPLAPGDYVLDINGAAGTTVIDLAQPFSVHEAATPEAIED